VPRPYTARHIRGGIVLRVSDSSGVIATRRGSKQNLTCATPAAASESHTSRYGKLNTQLNSCSLPQKSFLFITASLRLPLRLYIDNAKIYRSPQLARIGASLGTLIIHSRPYQPEGRGKIERFFRTSREQGKAH